MTNSLCGATTASRHPIPGQPDAPAVTWTCEVDADDPHTEHEGYNADRTLCHTWPVSAANDMHRRMVPAPAAVELAKAAFALYPDADLAAVPVAFPGKTPGMWTVGQKVLTVPGAVFVGHNQPSSAPVAANLPDYGWCRDKAAQLARFYLNYTLKDTPGTVGWATVYPDGEYHIVEDVL